MAEEKKDDNKRKTNHLDELFFGEGGQAYYHAQASAYLLQLVKNTPINSRLAYSICHAMEANEITVGDINENFPSGKASYVALKEQVAEQRGPLEEEQAEINKQIKKLKEKKKEDHKEALAKLTKDSGKLAKQLEELPDPVYKPRYPNISDKGAVGKPREVDPADWKKLTEALEAEAAKLKDAEPETYLKNLNMISKELGLSDDEVKVLTFIATLDANSILGETLGYMRPTNQRQYNGLAARLLGIDSEKVSALFRPESHLMQYGLLTPPMSNDDDDDFSRPKRIDGIPIISEYFNSVLTEPDITASQIKEKLTGHTITTDLDWEKDFKGLGKDGQRTVQLVERAIEDKMAGKNISGPTVFFHGEPDTGKTTAVAALVGQLKKKHPEVEVRVIGERGSTENNEGSGAEPAQTKPLTAQDRISQIKMALALGGKNPKTLFLVEEPSFLPRENHDDGIKDDIDRVVIQRLFENHGATALFFTTNHYPEIHSAVRRRATQAIEFRTSNAESRREILARQCAKHNIQVSDEDLTRLANTYTISAGKWASAVSKAAITAKPGDGINEIEYWIQNQAKRDYGSIASVMALHKKPEHGYDFKLLNAVNPTVPLDELFERVKNLPEGRQRFRMLLEGWPGTGKSEFVWHLAEIMGKEVIHAKASDILDKYVGESEKNIARFFDEAQERGAILLIDEVDSVIRNRKDAEKSWEVTQVNQFLTSLEHYNGMVACTTNDFDSIDSAAKRRFNFTMGFDFLTDEQNLHAFEKFFKKEPPKDYEFPVNLTPSDYATVLDQAKFMGRQDDTTFITRQLDATSKAKPKEDRPRNMPPPSIGFHTQAVRKSGAGARPTSPDQVRPGIGDAAPRERTG